MDLKTLPVTGIKAGPADGLEEGEAWVYASTWTREPDAYGDVVKKGAFRKTIREWAKSGNELPILFGHRMDDPDYFIGGGKELIEDDHGLLVKIRFDLEPGSKSEKVYRLVKGRRITQLSFAYDVVSAAMVKYDGEQKADNALSQMQVRELRELKLYEVSVVPVGANQDTEVLAVKAVADGLRAGRPLSIKNLASLRAARDSLDEVITTLESTDPEKDASPAGADGEVQEDKPERMSLRSAEALVAFIETL